MKKVSIIIPFKGQTEAELMLPLSSIYNQIGVDLSQLDIHLVNDGGKTIDLSKFDVLADRLEIHYHEIPNGGPGVARQYGIDNSISEYIMFIDADDVLYYVGALWPFYNASNQGHQMIRASYWEQIAGNPYTYTVHGNGDRKAAYGKWYKRSYIEMLGLRFMPDLPVYEDTYFVGLACELATDTCFLEEKVYMWLANPNSITRTVENKFNYQAHIYARENRYWFEMIRKWKPECLVTDFENYLTNMYLKSQKYPPVDEKAWCEEQHKLITSVSDIFSGWTQELQKQVEDKSANPQNEWHGIETDGFKEWATQSLPW